MKIIILPLLLVFFTLGGSGTVEMNDFTAHVSDNNRNEIILEWTVAQEVNVDFYRVRRKMASDSQFRLIREEQARAGTAAKVYRIVDEHVFKSSSQTETVAYELQAVFLDGTDMVIGQAETSYTTNAVRRTWGNIKSMFQ